MHTPEWELSGEAESETRRRFSVPTLRNTTTVASSHVGRNETRGTPQVGGKAGGKGSNTSVSLLSIATDSLALQSVLDGRKGSDEGI